MSKQINIVTILTFNWKRVEFYQDWWDYLVRFFRGMSLTGWRYELRCVIEPSGLGVGDIVEINTGLLMRVTWISYNNIKIGGDDTLLIRMVSVNDESRLYRKQGMVSMRLYAQGSVHKRPIKN